MRVPDKLIDFIKKEKQFLILSHIYPEGDALGSSIALAIALRNAGREVKIYNRDGVPDIYSFLPGSDMVRTSITDQELSTVPAIIIDCNSPERVGLEGRKFFFTAVIDHHQTEKPFGDIKWVEPHTPATGMMVYNLICELGLGITPEIATNLYTAIAVDTGTFRYGNTTSDTLKVAAGLVEAGANPGEIAAYLYESWSRGRFLLLRRMLENLEFVDIGNNNHPDRITIAISVITQDMFRETGTRASDTENFSNFPRMIKDVGISAMFRETDDGKWKASLRSRGSVDVSVVAAALGGGGHCNAAGFLLEGSFDDVKRTFLDTVRDNLL